MLGGLQCPINRSSRPGLHAWKHVAVEVERDSDLAVPEALACDLWMDAGGEQMRGMRVSEIVETNPFQASLDHKPGKGLREAVRL